MASTAIYQEFPPAANGTKPTELLCEVTAGGNPPALHCRGAVDDQHHGAGTPLEGDVQSKITGQQPDETLIQKQGPGAVQFLIHVDADVDICKHNETTAYMALQSIDKNGGASALFLASKNGIDKAGSPFISLAQSANGVVDTKETPEFTNQGGQTAVQHLQADGDVNQCDKDTTPLDPAVQEQHEQHADVFRQLLDAADGNPQDVKRAVPLFTTFQKGFNDIVRELLDKHADPKISIESGASPLYVAAMKGQREVCRMLLGGRADANQTPGHQKTPLLVAILNGHEEVADLFLDRADVDVDKADDQGNRPLLAATKASFWNVAEQLTARGAKVDGGIFDEGVAKLRALAEAVAPIATAEFVVDRLQTLEIPSGSKMYEIINDNIDSKMSISGIQVDDSLEASVDVKKATCLEDVEVETADSGKTTQLKANDSTDSSDLEPFEAEKDVKCKESNFQEPFQAASCEDTEDPFALGGQSESSADEATSSTTPLGCCNEETWPDFVTHSCSPDASASVAAVNCQALPH